VREEPQQQGKATTQAETTMPIKPSSKLDRVCEPYLLLHDHHIVVVTLAFLPIPLRYN
jgi:hypothetical protein